ncbi:MAG: hypothetical protein NT011_03555 [Kiritimatiellaeota bacterium]|nr:hypothetical protein [Kiritimatiellota bacterium]
MYWIIICIILLPLSIFGENITTRNGKVYKDVQIFKQESDRLMVTYPGGAATIYLADCTEDIQRKYNYNTTDADTAKSEREKKAQTTQEQLQKEQKAWVNNQNIQTEQAGNDKVQINNDDYKREYKAAKKAYDDFMKDYAPSYLKISIYHLYDALIQYCVADKEFAFLV